MTVSALQAKCGLKVLSMPAPDREIAGVYTGDLLSWVMGRAKPDQAWVTIMTNINVPAVASLIDLSVVICCENSEPENDVIEAAKEKGVNILLVSKPAYETCLMLSEALSL